MAKKIDYSSFLRSDVLALDIATHTGFHSLAESGEWDFTESMRRNRNQEHRDFRETLIDCIERNNIKVITAEDLIYKPGRFTATRKLGEYRGILLEVCDTLDLPEPYFVAPSHIKITACNKGNASKEEVMAGILKRYGIDVEGQDNRADAIACFFTFINKFRITE